MERFERTEIQMRTDCIESRHTKKVGTKAGHEWHWIISQSCQGHCTFAVLCINPTIPPRAADTFTGREDCGWLSEGNDVGIEFGQSNPDKNGRRKMDKEHSTRIPIIQPFLK